MALARLLFIGVIGLSWIGGAPVTVAQTAQPKVFELELAGGKLARPSGTVRVTQGDRVELRWTSDEPAELHLHGYDVGIHVAPGTVGVMAFDAHATGRFPITIHGPEPDTHGHGHATLVYLEVHPR